MGTISVVVSDGQGNSITRKYTGGSASGNGDGDSNNSPVCSPQGYFNATGPPISVGLCSNSFSASALPTQTKVGSTNVVQTTFTNNYGNPVTGIVYAVVHNSQGQTVAYSTATLTNVPPGATATATNVLYGLPPGTYSATVFVTDTNGTSVSSTYTVTVEL